jgi:hypothetical protein
MQPILSRDLDETKYSALFLVLELTTFSSKSFKSYHYFIQFRKPKHNMENYACQPVQLSLTESDPTVVPVREYLS